MTDIVVVGGGPVGLMLAYELGQAGVDVVLIERAAEPVRESPGMAINSAVVEMLNQRGLMDSLRAIGFEWPQAHFAHIFLDPAVLDGQHPYSFIIPHSKLERHLADEVAELGVDVRRGHEIIGFDQDENGVVAQVCSSTGAYSIDCEYLVGCDGAGSTVRELAGIDFRGGDAPFYGLIGDFEVDPGSELFNLLGPHQYPGGLVTVGPLGPTVLRITTGEFGTAPEAPELPPTSGELQARIKQITGMAPAIGEPIWLSRWDNATRHADRYRSGRVFVAGDAAHVHFPLGGQALSTGMDDAVNLGWKLAAQINGWAPAGLLDTYHAERHPAGARACLTTKAQVALMAPQEEIGSLRDLFKELVKFGSVNEYLVKMVGGLDVRYSMEYPGLQGKGVRHPLVGSRIANIKLKTPHRQTDVADLLRGGHGVLLNLSEQMAWTRPISAWSDRVDVVDAEPIPQIDAVALLIRPDGRVAWALSDIADTACLHAALTTWFGVPGPEAAG